MSLKKQKQKNEEQEGRIGPVCACGGGEVGGWYQWEEGGCGERVNMVQTLCTDTCKWKNETF
jgi:hypothetical protein